MALSDTFDVVIGASTISVTRIGGPGPGEFRSADKNVKVLVSNQENKRTRQTFRIDHRKVAADPLTADQNLNYSMSAYVVLDTPPVGYSSTEILDVLKALSGVLSASTWAIGSKFVNGES